MQVEILFLEFEGVVKIWIVIVKSAIGRVVALLCVDGGLVIGSANVLQR